MDFRKTDKGYIVKLKLGEPIIKSLTDLSKAEQIKSGEIKGIGAASNAVIGFYSLSCMEYKFKRFEEEL